MRKSFLIVLLVIFALTLWTVVAFGQANKVGKTLVEIQQMQTKPVGVLLDGEWYYKDSLAAAPGGLPDFDQGQFPSAYCGPTAGADLLWWQFAKKGISMPAPATLINEIAVASGTVSGVGTICDALEAGLLNVANAHGGWWFAETTVYAANFNYIQQNTRECHTLTLLLGFWQSPDGVTWYRFGGHFVAVSGVYNYPPTYQVALSDPAYDNTEAGGPGVVHHDPANPWPHVGNPLIHNNPANASKDWYPVAWPSVSPGGYLYLPTYTANWPDFQGQNAGPFPNIGTFNPSLPVNVEVEQVVDCYAAKDTQYLEFYQMDFNLNGTITHNSDWGLVDLTFTGSDSILYFNLTVNDSWQVENIPVFSSEGPGVSQTLSFYFDLGNTVGDSVTSLQYAYQLTRDTLSDQPSGHTIAPVGYDQIVLYSSLQAEPSGSVPPPACPMKGGSVDVSKGWCGNVFFPNQYCDTGECLPAAVSNSLRYLNSHYKMGMDTTKTSLKTMKEACRWTAKDGCSAENWYAYKDTFMTKNGYAIKTKSYDDASIDKVYDKLCQNQDIEMNIGTRLDSDPNHGVAVVGMTKLADGKWEIEFKDDPRQGPNHDHKLRTETITWDPDISEFTDGPFKGRGIWNFVVECPKLIASPPPAPRIEQIPNHSGKTDSIIFSNPLPYAVEAQLSGPSWLTIAPSSFTIVEGGQPQKVNLTFSGAPYADTFLTGQMKIISNTEPGLIFDDTQYVDISFVVTDTFFFAEFDTCRRGPRLVVSNVGNMGAQSDSAGMFYNGFNYLFDASAIMVTNQIAGYGNKAFSLIHSNTDMLPQGNLVKYDYPNLKTTVYIEKSVLNNWRIPADINFAAHWAWLGWTKWSKIIQFDWVPGGLHAVLIKNWWVPSLPPKWWMDVTSTAPLGGYFGIAADWNVTAGFSDRNQGGIIDSLNLVYLRQDTVYTDHYYGGYQFLGAYVKKGDNTTNYTTPWAMHIGNNETQMYPFDGYDDDSLWKYMSTPGDFIEQDLAQDMNIIISGIEMLNPDASTEIGVTYAAIVSDSNLVDFIRQANALKKEFQKPGSELIFRFLYGDANQDTKVTVSDVVYLVNYLFKGGSEPWLLFSDCNNDQKVSVSDVVYLVNYLFKGGPIPATPAALAKPF